MTWLDHGIGACSQCQTERRLFAAETRPDVLLCSLCAAAWDRSERSKAFQREVSQTRVAVLVRELRKQRAAAGLCRNCGKAPVEVRKWCRACSAEYNGAAKARRAMAQSRVVRMERGACYDCERPATRGLRCDYHAELAVAKAYEWQAKRRAAGCCIRCSGPSREGMTMCQRCANKANRLRNQRKRAALSMAARGEE